MFDDMGDALAVGGNRGSFMEVDRLGRRGCDEYDESKDLFDWTVPGREYGVDWPI